MYHDDQPSVGLSAERTEAFVLEHGTAVLRVARAYCSYAADAEDVYQRTLEILMLKAPALEDAALVSWACTVARNEALMLSRGPRGAAKDDFDGLAESLVADLPTPEDHLLDEELLGQGRDLLARLRPDQARCLLLRADDLSYPEICEKTGFSYAKVNRLLSDGRKALRLRHEMLVSGNDCRRLEDSLSMFADGVADAEVTAEIEAHVKHCLGCRAAVRDYREAPRRLDALLPVGLLITVADDRSLLDRLGDQLQNAFAQLQERIFGHVASGQQASEAAMVKKVAAIAAMGGVLIAGGAAVEKTVSPPKPAPSLVQTPSARLLDAVDLTAAERRRGLAERTPASAKARSASDADLLARDGQGRDQIDADPLADQTAAADNAGYAADPADAAPDDPGTEPKWNGVGP